jgi:hypothetical protein
MTSERFDSYLRRLQTALQQRGLLSARIVDEARDHLLDAIDDGMRRGLSREAAERDALERFGSADMLGAEFQRVYRWSYALWYLTKIAATVVASAAVALAIEVAVNLRGVLQDEALRLAPQFGRTSLNAVAVVLGLATVWEISRAPFQLRRMLMAIAAYVAVCLVIKTLFAEGIAAFGAATLMVAIGTLSSRLERRPVKLFTTFAVFVLSLVVIHKVVHVVIEPTQAALAGAVLIAIWTSTITILSRGDRILGDILRSHQ